MTRVWKNLLAKGGYGWTKRNMWLETEIIMGHGKERVNYWDYTMGLNNHSINFRENDEILGWAREIIVDGHKTVCFEKTNCYRSPQEKKRKSHFCMHGIYHRVQSWLR
jgi:hypothetical protein